MFLTSLKANHSKANQTLSINLKKFSGDEVLQPMKQVAPKELSILDKDSEPWTYTQSPHTPVYEYDQERGGMSLSVDVTRKVKVTW